MTAKTKTILLASAILCAAPVRSMAVTAADHVYGITVIEIPETMARQLPRTITAQGRFVAALRAKGGKVLREATLVKPAGGPARFDQGEEIPYVSSLSTPGDGGPVVPGTGVVRVGTHVELMPTARAGVISVRYESSRLVRFVTLDAGAQLGRLTQPETAKVTMSARVRDAKGVTHVLPAGRGGDGARTVLLVTRTS